MSRLLARPSVAGDGLLQRARSVAFALFGVTAAIGLGLVALISNLSWPAILESPIPGLPAQHMAVHDRTVAAAPALRAGRVLLRHPASPRVASARSGSGVTRLPGDGSNRRHLSGSEQVLVSAPPPGQGAGPPLNEGPAGVPSNPPSAAPVSAPPPPPSATPVTSSPPPVVVTAKKTPSEGHVKSRRSSKGEGASSNSNAGDHGHPPHAPPVVKAEPPAQPPSVPAEEASPPPSKGGNTSPGSDRGQGHGYGHFDK